MAPPEECEDLEVPLQRSQQEFQALLADTVDCSGEPDARGQVQSSGTSWRSLAWILLGDMFGVSIFALPGVYARLGWGLATAMNVLVGVAVLYSGKLFTQLAAKVPNAKGLEDYGTAAYGERGLWLTRCTVSFGIFLTPAFFHLSAAQALQSLLWRWGVSFLTCAVIVAVVVAPLAQIQSIANAGWVGVVSTATMSLAVVIVIVKLVRHPAPETGHQLVNTGDPRMSVIALLDLVFCYGGQQNWARFMTGLHKRSQFQRSVALASTFMTIAFVVLGALGYLRLGLPFSAASAAVAGENFDMDKPVTALLNKDSWSIPMNAGVFAHCVLGYQLNLNTWADMVLRGTQPADDAVVQEREGLHAKPAWSLATIAGILMSGAIAWAVPFFSSLMGLISAFGDLQAAYSLPALFALKMLGDRLPRWQRIVNYTLIPVSLVVFGLGVYSTVYAIVEKYKAE